MSLKTATWLAAAGVVLNILITWTIYFGDMPAWMFFYRSFGGHMIITIPYVTMVCFFIVLALKQR